MKITLLVLQRKCRYPGELAPEVMAVVDEITLDDNPPYWPQRVAEEKATIGGEADRWAEIVVELDDAAIERALYPIKELFVGQIEETR